MNNAASYFFSSILRSVQFHQFSFDEIECECCETILVKSHRNSLVHRNWVNFKLKIAAIHGYGEMLNRKSEIPGHLIVYTVTV